MSVALHSGANAADKGTINPVTKAMRVNLREPDTTGGGLFRVSQRSGATTGLAAAAPIFSLRNGSASVFCALQYVGLSAVITTANGGAAGVAAYEAVIARSFTASDTGNAVVTLTGNLQKKNTGYTTSVIASAGDMRLASTGAALGAGTRILDNVTAGLGGFASCQAGIIASAAAGVTLIGPMVDIFDARDLSEGPIVFGQNEGFIIRTAAAYPATVAITLQIAIAWVETTTAFA